VTGLDALARLLAPMDVAAATVARSLRDVHGHDPVLLVTRVPRPAPRGWIRRGVHHQPPPSYGPGWRDQLRRGVFDRTVVELARAGDNRPRRLDAILDGAELANTSASLRIGSGGGVYAVVRNDLVFRAGPGAAAEAAALQALIGSDDGRLPRPVASGTTDGIDWVVETRLPGAAPDALTDALVADVVDVCGALPRGARSQAWTADVDTIRSTAPYWDGRLATLTADVDPVLATVPGVLRHGDLWSGNLLAVGGRLRGLVDWDGSQLDGVPGADLLHLATTAERHRRRVSLGTVALDQPWSAPSFVRATAKYWSTLGIEPSANVLRACGVGWWAGQLAGDLRRNPDLATDGRWVAANIDAVLASHTF